MTTTDSMADIEKLASHRRCQQHLTQEWQAFLERRQQRLQQQVRHGGKVPEKVAENIIEDLLTQVLDWNIADVTHQLEFADMVLAKNGVKYLLIELKRPGSLSWHQHAVDCALAQASRYAAEQHIKCIAVSDGSMFYAANVQHGGLKDRIFVSLQSPTPPPDLWWISVHGIYRPQVLSAACNLLPATAPADTTTPIDADEQLHPKYHLPATCFAYVGNATQTSTWKLPYRLDNGAIDEKRLPKAIQAILSNYRGAKVGSIPEEALPAVLQRLAQGAEQVGKMPKQQPDTAMIYQQLADVLEQFTKH